MESIVAEADMLTRVSSIRESLFAQNNHKLPNIQGSHFEQNNLKLQQRVCQFKYVEDHMKYIDKG